MTAENCYLLGVHIISIRVDDDVMPRSMLAFCNIHL